MSLLLNEILKQNEKSLLDIESLQVQLQNLKAQLDQVSGIVNDIRTLVGPFGVKIDDDQLLVQTLYGTKYLIDPHDLIMTMYC
jgi:hypothetical protein